jgi:hypothetical protein
MWRNNLNKRAKPGCAESIPPPPAEYKQEKGESSMGVQNAARTNPVRFIHMNIRDSICVYLLGFSIVNGYVQLFVNVWYNQSYSIFLYIYKQQWGLLT